jgi:hypothetical protein
VFGKGAGLAKRLDAAAGNGSDRYISPEFWLMHSKAPGLLRSIVCYAPGNKLGTGRTIASVRNQIANI